MIAADHAAEHAEAAGEKGEAPPRWSELLRLRQTWGAIAAKGLTDPVWFMIADWFAIYLVSRGYSLEQTAAGYWVPFLGLRPRQLLRRRLLRLAHPPRVAGRARAPAGDRGRVAGRLRARSPRRSPRATCSCSRASPWPRSPTRRCRPWPTPCPPTSSRAGRWPRWPGWRGRPREPARIVRDANSSASSPTASPSPRSWWSRASCRSPPRSSSSPSCATRRSRAAACSR